MTRARVEAHTGGTYIVCGQLVQTDWDWPTVAESLGWSLTRVQKRGGKTVVLKRRPTLKTNSGAVPLNCAHRSTDGTVACRECGITASEFIGAAGSYLDRLAGYY